MKSSFSKKILRSFVALNCFVGSALGVGSSTLVNAKTKTNVILQDVPAYFKKEGVETLGNLYSYVMCELKDTRGPVSAGDLKFYFESLERLFPNAISFRAAKGELKKFDYFIFALGKTMNKYTWERYYDEKKSKNYEEQAWVRQRGFGIADGPLGRWGYEEVDDLFRKVIRVWLEKNEIWD